MPKEIRDPAILNHAAGTATSITEIRRQESLLKTGALQNAILNSANFSSIATDAKGVIQIFNVGAERMLGYAAADVLNKITPADISDPQEVIARAKVLSVELSTPITPGFEALVFKASRGIEDIYELTYIRKDGSRFPAIVSVTALRDAHGAIIGYLLIGTDNTARKLAKRELEETNIRLNALINSPADIIIFSLDNEYCYTAFNEKHRSEMRKVWNTDIEIGMNMLDMMMIPELRDLAKQSMDRVLSGESFIEIQHQPDQDTYYEFNWNPIRDEHGEVIGIVAFIRDVTERNRLDQVLQEKNLELENARSVAEKANLAKSEFLSSMSHELRSPLNAILGFAQLIESDTPPPTPVQKQSLTQILQAGWHLLKLIDEILDLAKIESGKVPLSPEPVSLGEILLECEGMIETQAQQRGIQLTFPRFDFPHFVHADRTRLKQVLINLLSNAIKYNRPGGMVVVDCTTSNPARTRISVRDTGAGLRPEKLAQLFEAFNRLGQEGSGVEGTGIGLVVAKRLVELMGGEIGVESTVGVGSVFWFELIAVAEPDLPMIMGDAMAFAQPQVDHGAELHTVLYVEDNPANLKLVEQIIARRPDLRLLTATNGSSGVAIARLSQPSMILMDINLPGIDGFEALKILDSDPATAHIPVVALSANAMPRDIKKGLQAGFLRYITKPIKVNEFMDAVDAALEFAGINPEKSQ